MLELRTKHAALSFAEDKRSAESRARAMAALERYIYLIIYASYVADSDKAFSKSFTRWLHERNELEKLTASLNKHSRFQLFSPVHDLSALVRPSAVRSGKLPEVQTSGDEVVSNEWSRQIVKVELCLWSSFLKSTLTVFVPSRGQASFCGLARSSRRINGKAQTSKRAKSYAAHNVSDEWPISRFTASRSQRKKASSLFSHACRPTWTALPSRSPGSIYARSRCSTSSLSAKFNRPSLQSSHC